MSHIRNLTWRLTALCFIALFGYALYVEYVAHQAHLASVPRTTQLGVLAALAIGFFMRGRLLLIPSTLNHEVGHALMASILREKVQFIRVEIDTSGVTYTQGKMSRLHMAARSAAGPLASAALMLFTSLLITQDHAAYWILFTLISTVLITVTTVRSIWGWVSAAIVSAVLVRGLHLSLQFSSGLPEQMAVGIWSNSTWNLPLLFTAYSAGIGLRYSWACRRPFSESQDEAKVGRAFGLGPRFGGYLILILNIALTTVATGLILT